MRHILKLFGMSGFAASAIAAALAQVAYGGGDISKIASGTGIQPPKWDENGYCREVLENGKRGRFLPQTSCGVDNYSGGVFKWDEKGDCRYLYLSSERNQYDVAPFSDTYCGGGIYKHDQEGYCRYVSKGGRWYGLYYPQTNCGAPAYHETLPDSGCTDRDAREGRCTPPG